MNIRALCILLIVVVIVCANCSHSYENKNDRTLDRTSEFNKSDSIRTYPKKKIVVQEIKKKQITEGIIPARLYIPSIDLHATIEPVSVSENGQMGVPRSTDRVGYLSNGVLPGMVGNAVMDGHVDNYKGPAVFFQLSKLKKDDIVVVQNDKGYNISFIVESVDTYKASEAPIKKIFGPAYEPRLNLITCAGKYSRKKREHEARLVVFTKRIVDM